MVLPIGVGTVGEVEVTVVPKMQVGGIWWDDQLTMQPHLEVCCARVVSQAEALGSSLDDAGFGLPFVVESQFWLRVVPSAQHGAEVLASHVKGWKSAAKRLLSRGEVYIRPLGEILG